jgi:molybdenum cofactor biosynthesis enzyme MoaA
MRGFNEDEILDFVEFTKDKDIYVRFIEYMPFDGNSKILLTVDWKDKKMVSLKEIIEQVEKKYKLIKVEDSPNDTSKGFKVPGFVGKIGVISSMTDHFCGSCNRIRLTADGNLKVCLFGNEEVSLRDMLRAGCSEEEIYLAIEKGLKGKKFSHAEMNELAANKNRPMITIGG